MYLDFADAIKRLGQPSIAERYGNLFEMYERITDENPYERPMRVYPAVPLHDGRPVGRLRADDHHPRALRRGEANFADQGANRLGASALMQGLADGYFVLPYTVGNYLAPLLNKPMPGTDHPAFKQAEQEARDRFTASCRSAARARPTNSTASWARSSGTTAAWSAPRRACRRPSAERLALYEEFQTDLRVPATARAFNQSAREGRPSGRLLPAR